MTQLRRHFTPHLGVYECLECHLPMHVDAHKADSTIRIIMCENSDCSDFGFAWRVDIETSVGVSDRSEPECTHPPEKLVEVPASTVRYISTPQHVHVGDELKTAPLPEGMRVWRCAICNTVVVEKEEAPSQPSA
jgi:hypothetical protein